MPLFRWMWLTLILLSLGWTLSEAAVCAKNDPLYCTDTDELDLPSIKVLGVPVSTSAFDEDGELLNPEISTGSFIFNGAGAPAAGSCPHNKAFYRDTVTVGDSYICYGVGQNWYLIGEFDDAINGLIPETGTTIAAVGATNVTMTGGACVQVTGNNTTKTLTTDLVCSADAQGDLLVRGATSYQRLPRGTVGQIPRYDGTSLVVSNPVMFLTHGGVGTYTCSNPGPTSTVIGTSGAPVAVASRLQRQSSFPVDMTIVAMKAHIGDTGGVPAGETVTVRLEEAGVDTTATCTMTVGQSSCTATGLSVLIEAGNLVNTDVACGGGVDALSQVYANYQYK